MRFLRTVLSVCILISIHFICAAQETSYDDMLPKPMTPNEAALFKFVETPVSLHSGLAQISIPIYTVEEGGIQVPISLSYHSGGIRVEEVASWVGLGWSLNAGGVVSRQVNGIPDDIYNGYMDLNRPQTIEELYGVMTNWVPDGYPSLTAALRYERDYEPDVFSFSMGGYSGKFYYDQNIEDFVILPKDNYRIETLKDINGIQSWIITVPNGTKYYFGKYADDASGQLKITSDRSFTFDTNTGFKSGGQSEFPSYIGSWYLMHIESPDNKEINFTYQKNNWVSQIMKCNEEHLNRTCGYPEFKINFIERLYNEVLIEEISFSEGKVVFNMQAEEETRLDLLGARAVKNIEIYDFKDSLFKSFELKTDYFVSGPLEKWGTTVGADERRHRLYLKEIVETDKYGNKENPYIFEYNPTILPERLSDAQDYWGYYNGIHTNPNLIPRAKTGIGIFFGNADRSVKPYYAKACMLEKITYPTKGVSEFVYGSNIYENRVFEKWVTQTGPDFNHLNEGNPIIEENIIDVRSAWLIQNDTPLFFDFVKNSGYAPTPEQKIIFPFLGDDDYIYPFNLPYSVQPELKIQTFISGCNEPYNTGTCDYIMYIADSEGNNVLNLSASNLTYTLPAGDYYIVCRSQVQELDDPDFSVMITGYKKETPDGQTYGGGLRVNKIINHFGNGKTTEKYYEYDFGYLYTIPAFIDYEFLNSTCDPTVLTIKISSNSFHSLTTSGGGFVGYAQAKEYYTEDGKSGLKVFDYSIMPTIQFFKMGYAFITPSFHENWKDGNLLRASNFSYKNSEYKLESVVYNQYEQLEGQKSITGVALRPTIGSGNVVTFNYGFYEFYTDYFRKKREIHRSFFDSKCIEDTIEYIYDNNKLMPSAKIHKNSQGLIETERYYYPDDISQVSAQFPAGQAALIAELDKNNSYQIGQPIQQEKEIGDALTIKQYNFGSFNGKIKPASIKTSRDRVNFDTEIEFTSFDAKGNLIEAKKRDGVMHSFIWAYDYSKLMAQIQGLSIAEVITILGGQTNLDNLNQSTDSAYIADAIASLKSNIDANYINASIEYSSYKPLVGISSMTDRNGNTTYYDYDNLGRLELIKDKDKNILKEYTYGIQSDVLLPPSGLQVIERGFNTVSLSWSLVNNANKYKIYRSVDGTNYTVLTEITSNSFQDNNLSPLTEYYYKVQSVMEGHESLLYSTISVVTKLAPPGLPVLNGSSPSSSSITLTWADVANESGYKLYGGTSENPVTLLASLGENASSYTHSGLTGGAQYYYKLEAFNIDYSSTTAVLAKITRPIAPTLSSASPISNTQINLSWADVQGETGYEIYKDNNLVETTGANTTTFASTGLLGNTTYQFAIKAINTSGVSDMSNAISSKTKFNTPDLANLSASSPSSSSITLTWSDVADESGYKVYGGTSSNPTELLANLGENASSYTYSGLAGGTQYYYKLEAFNVDYSSTTTVLPIITRPAAPGLTSASPFSNTQINITWADVQGETAYEIYRDNNLLATVGANTTSYASISLAANTTYQYSIKAVNGSGVSVLSNVQSCKTKFNPPGTPAVASSSPSATNVLLTWNNVQDESAYIIYRSTSLAGLDNPVYSFVTSLESDVTSYTDYNLASGTQYYYKVEAGNVDYKSPSLVSSLYTLPAAPSLNGGTVSNTRVDLSWTNVEGETGYYIYRDGAHIASLGTDASSYAATGLSGNTSYSFTVKAYNNSGASVSSNTKTCVTQFNPPGTPSVSLSSNNSTSIMVSWNDVADESGYRVYRGTSPSNVTTHIGTVGPNLPILSYYDNSLSSGATYYYKVEAYNNDNSSVSAIASLITRPAAPSLSSVAAISNTQLNVYWADVNGESSYEIYRDGGLIATVGANTTSFASTGLSGNTSYGFAVKAINSSGPSALSNTINGTTKQNPPGVPSINVSSPSSSSISVSWSNVSYESGYRVYRGTSPSSVSTHVATLGQDVTNYSDAGLASGTTYYYLIQAYNADYSSSSAVASAITRPAAPGSIGGMFTPCLGTSQTYTCQAVSSATYYEWVFPSSWSITGGQGTSSVTVTTGSSSGNVTVRAANASGYSDYQSRSLNPVVSVLPTPTQSGVYTACSNTIVVLSVNPMGGADSYQWTVPYYFTIVSGQGTSQLTVRASRSGTATVKAHNCVGWSPSRSVNLTINCFGGPGGL